MSADPVARGAALRRPIAVFDAGIGSYAIVAELRRRLPKQDILYLADRASFPYGGKGRDELLAVMRRTIDYLRGFAPSAIVIASNAPSIMALDDLRREYETPPLFGVYPPVAEALSRSRSGRVGVMGVRSLVESAELARFIAREAQDPGRVALFDASPMVEFVESGAFLFAPEETQRAIDAFVADIFLREPAIDVLTLSSTHLPWLKSFFETARPGCVFLDPMEIVLDEIGAGSEGTGEILGLVTESDSHGLETFRSMLAMIGVDIPLRRVELT